MAVSDATGVRFGQGPPEYLRRGPSPSPGDGPNWSRILAFPGSTFTAAVFFVGSQVGLTIAAGLAARRVGCCSGG
jgi:hypothetical protein